MKADKHFIGIALVPAARGLEGLRRRFSKPLLIVMTIVGLVLLIGCANVANLLLARASARRAEIELRLAIGASRSRLLRQLFTEGLLLSAIAARIGILFAKWGVSALVALFAGISGRIALEPRLDGDVMAFTIGVAIVTGLLFSIAPALYTIRTDASQLGGRTPASVGGFRFGAGRLLVLVQIMLSTALLCGAALFLRILQNLTHLDAGFGRESVLTMRVDATLPRSAPKGSAAIQEEDARVGRMWEDLLAPLRELRQVSAVSASSLVPLSGRRRGLGMAVSGEPNPKESQRGVSLNEVSAGFLEAFAITLLSGRVFTRGDQGNSPRVAILNESAARRALPIQILWGASCSSPVKMSLRNTRLSESYATLDTWICANRPNQWLTSRFNRPLVRFPES